MSPTQFPTSPSWVCLYCQEAELAAVSDTPWFSCPSCGHGYHQADLATYYSPERVAARVHQADQRAASNELAACWADQTRRRASGGGGDDGLSMTEDIPFEDDSIVTTTVSKSERVKVLRIKTLDAKTFELQRAIRKILLANP